MMIKLPRGTTCMLEPTMHSSDSLQVLHHSLSGVVDDTESRDSGAALRPVHLTIRVCNRRAVPFDFNRGSVYFVLTPILVMRTELKPAGRGSRLSLTQRQGRQRRRFPEEYDNEADDDSSSTGSRCGKVRRGCDRRSEELCDCASENSEGETPQ